jgi:hypothetical protein
MWDLRSADGAKLSFTTSSVPGEHNEVGTSNYYIPIYSSSDPNKLAMLLWFFDSKGGRVFQPSANDASVPSRVDEKVFEIVDFLGISPWLYQVVAWFRSTSSQIQQEQGRTIPSMAFVHIPISAALKLQTEGGLGSKTEPGLNEELVAAQGHGCDAVGNNCKYQNGADSPFMNALVDTEGLMAVFSGHSHGIEWAYLRYPGENCVNWRSSSWCMKWSKNLAGVSPTNGKGLDICFNRHSGYGGYSDWTRGARQIVVGENMLGKKQLETWIRLEDGNVSGRVTLNSTYGKTLYPEVRSSKTFRA